MSDSNDKRKKLKKRLKELEDMAKERYFDGIDVGYFLVQFLFKQIIV